MASYQYYFAVPASARVAPALAHAGAAWARLGDGNLQPLVLGAEAAADALLLGGSLAVALAAKQLLLAKRVGGTKRD